MKVGRHVATERVHVVRDAVGRGERTQNEPVCGLRPGVLCRVSVSVFCSVMLVVDCFRSLQVSNNKEDPPLFNRNPIYRMPPNWY